MHRNSPGRVFLAAALAFTAACGADPAAVKRRYVASGDRYVAAGKYKEAALEYRNALQQDARAGDVRIKLAEASLKIGDLPGAFGEFVRASDLLPDDAAVQLKAGNFLLVAGRFDDAKVRAEKILAKDPRNVDAQILAANAYGGLKDLDAAVAQIEEALTIDPARSGTYSNLGALELGRGRREAAERAFLKAAELNPGSVAAHLAVANFYWLNEQFPSAERSLMRALEIEPRNPLTNRLLANFYIGTKRREKAEQFLKTAYDATKTPPSAFALAEYYAGMNNGAAARAILESQVHDPANEAQANVRLAALDYKEGRSADAYARLTGVLTKNQTNLDALLLKSAFLLSDKKPNEALTEVQKAVGRYPDSTSAVFLLGRIQVARKQPDEAIAAFEQVLRQNPRATQAKVELAQLHLSQGRPDNSIGFAEEALANEPANGDAQLVLVRGLLARGDTARASVELTQLVARFPNSAAVHTQLGMLYGRKHDYAAAKSEFERALQLQPGAFDAFGGLVALDLTARNYASAKARLDARLASEPSAPLLTLAARAYEASGDRPAAERLLSRAMELDDTYLEAYDALGGLYIAEGKLSSARAQFESVVQRSPKSVSALTMVGIMFQAEGDIDAARARFERALQIDPEAAVAANNLAWIYADRGGNLDVAMHLAQVAQKRLPGVAEVSDTLGFIYYKKNLTSLAISTLKVSAEKDPGNATYQYHLGLAYASGGDGVRAKQSLEHALALQPDFSGAGDARERLASLRVH